MGQIKPEFIYTFAETIVTERNRYVRDKKRKDKTMANTIKRRTNIVCTYNTTLKTNAGVTQNIYKNEGSKKLLSNQHFEK